MADNKTAITADENDILRFADKIRQNQQEQSAFAANLHNVVKNKVRINKPLTIGITPNSLVICKADPSLEFTISKTVIDKCLKPEVRGADGRLAGKTGHGLSEKKLLDVLDNVKNPTMILQGNKPNSLVVVTDFTDNKDRQILVSVMLNKMGSSTEINDVTSAYGREDFANYIENQVNSGKLLAAHTEKANKLFQSIGKKYPEPDKFIGFDNSIAYSDRNVKYPSKDISKTKSVMNNADLSALRGESKDDMDKTFAYEIGHSAPFTVVHLDISTEERKNAVSEALKDLIDYYTDANGRQRDGVQPYKNLLEQIKPETEFIHAFQGHLSCLEYALETAPKDKELCMLMLDSIKQAEKNLTPVVTIKGYECIPKDTWEDQGVTYNIGQSVDDPSFYYVRAVDGSITRDYEYDHKPSREKVISDHTDKISEEAIDLGEAIYGADGTKALANIAEIQQIKIKARKPVRNSITELYTMMRYLQPEKLKEMDAKTFGSIFEQQEQIADLSAIRGKNNNAVPSAKRGERKNTMNTKFEVSSITKLDGENGTKALASVAINNELIVSGIALRESKEGNLYVQMPQQKNGVDEQGKDKYEDRVFPSTPEARKALDEAVIGAYEKLNEQGLDKSYIKIEPPEKSASKLTVSLSKTNSEKSDIKARGQITVDNCFVIKGVNVAERTNSKTNEKFNAVNLPHFKQDDKGNYPLVVTPISSDMHNKVNDAVLKTFNTQTRGVKFSELGDKEDTSSLFRQNNAFAEKLMNELDSKGIPYHAKIIPDIVKADVKIAGNTTVSFKTADKAAIENIRKSIANDERKPSALGEISKIKEEKAQTEKTAPAKEKTQQKSKSNNQAIE